MILVVALVPYGPLLAAITLMAAAAWYGRDRTPPAPTGPDEAQVTRLQSLYEALVPYFSVPEDPAPLYAHGGDWDKAFPAHEFDDDGRVSRLLVRYPAYFTDGEAVARARIEQLLQAKSGRGREYHFAWEQEGNELTVTVLPPLPTDICAQRFVTAPGETVLGFTDPADVQRTLPLGFGEALRDVPPVVWRTGARSTEPHLLAAGEPGSGLSTLVRSIALQALQYGDVVVVDGGGTGEYACLTGRDGVLAVESGLAGALASLEWAAHETERRLLSANHARQAGHPAPEDTKNPLWILLDRPGTLGHLAAADGHRDPQDLLEVPLRHGRAAGVTVVVAEQFDSSTLSVRPSSSTPARAWCSVPRRPRSWRPCSACRRTPPRPSTCRPAAATRGSAPAPSCASRSRRPPTPSTTRRTRHSAARCWTSCRPGAHRPRRNPCPPRPKPDPGPSRPPRNRRRRRADLWTNGGPVRPAVRPQGAVRSTVPVRGHRRARTPGRARPRAGPPAAAPDHPPGAAAVKPPRSGTT